MASYIHYENDADEHERGRIGGSSLLSGAVEWPKDRSGKKLMFLASIPSELLKSECGVLIPGGHVLSVFCPYQRGGIEHLLDMARGRELGYVVAHAEEAPRQEFADPILRAKKLALDRDGETDEDEFSGDIDDKIGGVPNWLQDRFSYGGYAFVMQLSGACFGNAFLSHRDVFGSAVVYVFYDSSGNKGLVTVQYS